MRLDYGTVRMVYLFVNVGLNCISSTFVYLVLVGGQHAVWREKQCKGR